MKKINIYTVIRSNVEFRPRSSESTTGCSRDMVDKHPNL